MHTCTQCPGLSLLLLVTSQQIQRLFKTIWNPKWEEKMHSLWLFLFLPLTETPTLTHSQSALKSPSSLKMPYSIWLISGQYPFHCPSYSSSCYVSWGVAVISVILVQPPLITPACWACSSPHCHGYSRRCVWACSHCPRRPAPHSSSCCSARRAPWAHPSPRLKRCLLRRWRSQ